MKFDFGHFSNPGRTGQVSGAHLINAYTEKQEESDGAKTPAPVYICPGLTRWDSFAYAGACRGMLDVKNHGIFAVLGNQLVQFQSAGTGQVWGAIGGSGMVTMASNMRDQPHIGIVTDDGLYYVADTADTSLTQIAAPSDGATPPGSFTDFPAPASICFLDRYFVFAIPDGRMFHSFPDDGETVDPLAYSYVSSRPFELVRIVAHRGALVCFGKRGVEMWEDVGSTPFAFASLRSSYDMGLLAKFAVAATTKALIWVDHTGTVQKIEGAPPQDISNHGLERAIQQLSYAGKLALHMHTYQFEGHEFVCLTSPQWTWEYDLATGLWHERRALNAPYWPVTAVALWQDKVLAGTDRDGAIYEIDGDSYTDGVDYFVFSAAGQIVHNFPNGLIVDEIRVDAVRGEATQSGDEHTDDPQMMLDWSDDGGKTWEGGLTASLGRAGERTLRVRFSRLGAVREPGRLFRFSCSAPVFRAIMNVDLRARELKR